MRVQLRCSPRHPETRSSTIAGAATAVRTSTMISDRDERDDRKDRERAAEPRPRRRRANSTATSTTAAMHATYAPPRIRLIMISDPSRLSAARYAARSERRAVEVAVAHRTSRRGLAERQHHDRGDEQQPER